MSLMRTPDGIGYKFHYDLNIIDELRMVANSNLHFVSNKIDLHKGKFSYFSWGRICTAMDRIEDTLDYINDTPIGNRGLRIAFDFIELLNNQFTIIQSIKALAEIFNVSVAEVKALKSAFNQSVCDNTYFTYLRSICSAHADNTSYREERSDFMKEDDIYTCPRIIWESTTHIYNDDRDLTVEIFDGKVDMYHERKALNIYSFDIHMNNWLGLIPKITDAIKKYNLDQYENFRKIKIKSSGDFSSTLEYLRYLENVQNERCGSEQEYIFERYIKIFTITLTEKTNQEKLEKYKNAIRYSLDFLNYQLQNMSASKYESTGIKYPDKCCEEDLFTMLYRPLYISGPFKDYGYGLSRIYYLEGTDYSLDLYTIRRQLEIAKSAINKYVIFTNSESDEETLALVELAFYLNALESNNYLNKNIPNSEKYRVNILTNDNYNELLSWEKDNSVEISPFELGLFD